MQASSNSDVQESLLEMAGLDFLVAIMTGESGTGDVMIRSLALRENPQMIVVLTTLVAVFVFWKRFSGQKPARPWEAPRPLIVREDPDVDLDPGKKKVAILFGTQTGIAEGFAKK